MTTDEKVDGYAAVDDPDLEPDPDPDDQGSIGDRLRKMLASGGEKEPLYPRVLRLEHVHPNGWQRALLVEGMAVAGGLVALADRATAWAPLILPIGAAAVVKFHDVLAGVLPRREPSAETRQNDSGGATHEG
ncbi:MAG TPA: hypothetical protein VNQ77_10800 [Frankiaceae bacterium]|nr:hypothetical protein [Frankiaceae bacterium]